MVTSLVRAERVIAAAPEQVFDLLADPARHPEIDGSGSVRTSHPDNPQRLSKGAEFGMDMRIGRSYRITNRVVEFEENERIAWRHFGGHRWRYLLTPVEGGTRVREEWDASRLPAPSRYLLAVTGFPERNRRGIEATLERLDKVLTDAG
jgi:uncharacterized protein YndB with AHSA1/START domain